MPTKEEAEKSFVLMMKDSNNQKITRIAFPEDVQIGTNNIPSELMLTGRFSVNSKEYEINIYNSGIINADSNDTIIGVSGSIALASARVNLPNNPRVGQLHHIKDIFGTAGISPINVYGSGGSTIDSASFKAINTAYSSLSVYWNGSEWKTFGGGGGGGVGPTGPTGATGATGPAGPAGPAGSPGPNQILWQQALNVDTGNARSGASGFNASALTTGNLFYISRETTIDGIQFFLPASVGPKTVRASLYNVNTNTRVAFVDVAAAPGVVTATFATPYVISGAGVGGQYAATMYLLDGSGHVYYQQINGWPVSPGLECIILGPNILWQRLIYSGGDNLDYYNAPTLDYAFKFPVDLILG